MSSCSSVSPVLARSARRWEHRSGGGRFRAEIEMDRGIAFPRSPELGFAAAVREPLVRLQRPRYDFERWDWGYFAWPHDRLDANLEMRDNDPLATFEADRKVVEGFLSRSIQQLEASQSTPQLEALEEFPSPRTPEPEAVQAFLGQSTLKLEIDDDVPPDSAPHGARDAQSPTPSCWSIARHCRVTVHTRSEIHLDLYPLVCNAQSLMIHRMNDDASAIEQLANWDNSRISIAVQKL